MTLECVLVEYGADAVPRGEVRHIGEIVPLVLARYLLSAGRSAHGVVQDDVSARERTRPSTHGAAAVVVELTRSREGAKEKGLGNTGQTELSGISPGSRHLCALA